MTVLGLKLSRRANAVSCAARPRLAPHVGPSLAVARRGRNSHRPHHQRRARSQLAGLADAAALRPHTSRPTGCDRMGEPEVWQDIHQRRSGRTVGNALRAEEPAAGLRPPPRQPAVPPPRRERRSGRGRPQPARSEHSHDRLRPALRHLQAGRPDHDRPRSAGRAWSTTRSGRSRSSSPARPIRPTSRASS